MPRCVSKAGSVWECLDQGKTPGGVSGETGGYLNICVWLQVWLGYFFMCADAIAMVSCTGYRRSMSINGL